MSLNKNKRIPKTPVKFKCQLSEEQKEAKRVILENDITILAGIAGSSKTFLACQNALDQFFTRKVERITIIRPTVATEDIGHLPGGVDEKMAMWMIPLVENMYKLYDKVKIDTLLKDGSIRMLPLQFTQGITFVDESVIVDEAQNMTKVQTEMVLTRLGTGSHIVLAGDPHQVQLKGKCESGLQRLIDIVPEVDELGYFELKENHRNPIVERIVRLYNQ
jgi:phosphate starvation-inducible PhoH-like protein